MPKLRNDGGFEPGLSRLRVRHSLAELPRSAAHVCVCACISIIYNSVVTCRHITSNTSASAPRNTTKIAVKKVSDVDVSMVRPELLFSMYKCCFLACFCASQRQQRLRTELTLAVPDGPVASHWTDRDQI